MKFKLTVLALVVVSTGLAATPIAAAPMASHSLAIPTASIDGIYVGTAGAYGLVVATW